MESATTVGHRVRVSAGVCLAAGVILLLAQSSLLAQNGPDNDADLAQGYVNSIFHHNDVDSINLYSGQLTIPIPLGPSYPIGPKLRLQLMMTYGSRNLEDGGPYTQPTLYSYSLVVGDPALGLGWTFTLGAIKPCKQGITVAQCFFAPDGSQHPFNLVRPGGWKTGDGSQYFLSGSGPYDMWDGDGNHYYFNQQVVGYDDPFPTSNPGYIHDFGKGRDGWYLSSVTDPFLNSYSVTYHDNTDMNPSWYYDESCALNMVTSPTGGGAGRWVPKTISFNGTSITVGVAANKVSSFAFPVLVNNVSTTATWSLSYDTALNGPVYPRQCPDQTTLHVNFDVLRKITLPADDSGTSPTYQFDYGTGVIAGILNEMILPTGGKLDYCYDQYNFYHGHTGNLPKNCLPVAPPTTGLVPGITQTGPAFCHAGSAPEPIVRQPELICSNDKNADDYSFRFSFQNYGVTRRTETLVGAVNVTDYNQYAFPFGEQGSTSNPQNAETLTVVVYPKADVNSGTDTGVRRAKAVRFNSTTIGQIVTIPGDRLGADVEERVFDSDPSDTSTTMPACGSGGEQAYCSSKSLRTTFRTYDYDNQASEYQNRRLSLENTIFGAGTCSTCPNHQIDYQLTASDCTTPVSGMCDWDSSNGRHYNVESHSGTAGGTIERNVTTFWDPQHWDGTSGTALPNIFKRRTEEEQQGASEVVRRFEFDATNGFLKGTSSYDPSQTVALVNCRFNDGSGNVGAELTKTLASQPSDTQCVTDYGNVFPAAGKGVGTNGDLFGKAYTYQHGELTSARWIYDDSTANNTFLFRSYQRGAKTGWIASSTDTSGLTTTYQYDNFGRIRLVTPPSGSGDLSTFVCYEGPNATSAYRAASALSCPVAGTAAVTTWQHYDYDGLGRTIRERRRLTTSTIAKRFTLYDGRGNANFNSEWVADAAAESVTGNVATTCTFQSATYSTNRPSTASGTYRMCYDPFGRPQEVIGAKHTSRVTVDRKNGAEWYSDTKEAASTLCINGSFTTGVCGGGSTSLTTTWRDAFGRTTEVDEPTGGTNTTYTYDVNGKLLSAKQGSQASRSFGYDTLGFLRSETSLEKGAVTYNTIGSLGNVRTETEPDSTVVSRTFDFAGRLAEVDAGGNKYIVNCYDGSSSPLLNTNCVDGSPNYAGGTNPNGKLTRRYGYNWIPTAGPTVDEQFDYTDTAGRLHSIATTVGNGDLTTTATETWTYTTLGLVNQNNHPRRSGDAAFPVTYAYDAGLPTSVTANSQTIVKSAATYNLAGGLATWTAGNTGTSVVTTITQDPSGLPRPTQIKALQGASSRFDTGTYSYDGGGNIMSESDTSNGGTFTYDILSRVTSAAYSGFSTRNFTYDNWGNLTQNGALTFTHTNSTNHISTAGFVYDGRGNISTTPAAYGGDSTSYDSVDRKYRNINSSSDWVNVYSGGDERVVKFPGNSSLVRREMARLVGEANKAAGKTGWSTAPDACQNLFTDVPCPSDPDSRWIETLVNHGIAAGTGGGLFQPDQTLTRGQMAAFVVKGYKTEPYTPPACQGIFTDVPCSNQFAQYIEVLYNEGVTAGCGTNPLIFCPGNPVTPWQILVWMTKTAAVPGGVAWGAAYHPVPRGSTYSLRDEQNRVVTELASTTSGAGSASPTIGRDNVFFGNLMVGTNSPAPTGWQYVVSDHVGSPRAILSSSGAVAESHKYWPYGEDTNTTPPTQKLAFALMERNDGAARYFDHARHQDYNLGRFVSVDHVRGVVRYPQTLNRYIYAGNNPLKFVDHTGLDFVLAGCGANSTQTNCDYQKGLLKRAVGDKSYADLKIGRDGSVTLGANTAAHFVQSSLSATLARGLTALISDKNTFSLVSDNPTMAGLGGGSYTKILPGGGANIYVDDTVFPKMTGDVLGTTLTAFAHEIGHALGAVYPALYKRLGAELGLTDYTRSWLEAYPINFEDRYRREVGMGPNDIRASYFGLGQDVMLDWDTNLVPSK